MPSNGKDSWETLSAMAKLIEEGDQLTLRIFTLLLVNSFLIGSAVAIHAQGIWFPDESSWPKLGALWMMAATFVQMIAFMLYKVFFQERLEDQSYIQNLMTQTRRNTKRMNAELQRFSLSLEMEQKQREMQRIMQSQKDKILSGEGLNSTPTQTQEPEPQISLAPSIRDNLR
tara:strand:+ start:87 stop:602 length:516 start_codon:yes stop_codon:yes gene_type:complete